MSRGAAGDRIFASMLQSEGFDIRRFKVRKLLQEAELISKQPGSHRYKQAKLERPDIPNRLKCEFSVTTLNEVWSGDITYIWSGVIAAVLDLFSRRVVRWALSDKPNEELTCKALDMAWEQ